MNSINHGSVVSRDADSQTRRPKFSETGVIYGVSIDQSPAARLSGLGAVPLGRFRSSFGSQSRWTISRPSQGAHTLSASFGDAIDAVEGI
jgi:hypothetical protein